MDKNDITREKIKALRSWTTKKIQLELHGRQTNFHEGELYWIGLGKNIGVEMYGKGGDFSRPVLVYKKLSKYNFLAIPLTTKEHNGSWYVHFFHKGRKQTAVLSQIRVLSSKRIYRRIGQIDDEDFRKIKRAFRELYC